MKLYYKPGACSLASHITLIETDANFSIEKVDTEKGQTETGADFSKINPNGYVATLQTDDEEIVTENAAILQYLADLRADRELAPPAGTMARVRLQELLNFTASELHKAFSPFFSGGDLSESERGAAIANVGRRVAHIERLLDDGRDFLLGEKFTVGDAYAFVVLNWSNFVGIDLTPWPKTKAFMDRVAARPAVVRAMQAEGLIEGAA